MKIPGALLLAILVILPSPVAAQSVPNAVGHEAKNTVQAQGLTEQEQQNLDQSNSEAAKYIDILTFLGGTFLIAGAILYIKKIMREK